MAILDDLLSHNDDAASSASRRRRGCKRLAGVAVACAGLTFVVQLCLETLSLGAPFGLVFAVLMSLSALYAMARHVGARPLPPTLLRLPERPPSFDYASEDGIVDAVKRWQTRLDWNARDASRFADTTQLMLIQLIDERLRLRHGVSRVDDPERARLVLGPRLWRFVNEPVRRTPRARDLAGLVVQMEAL